MAQHNHVSPGSADRSQENIQLNTRLLENQLCDVRLSKDLLQQGIKTDLVSQLEALINDPAQKLFSVTDSIDEIFKKSIDLLVREFFARNQEKILYAYRTKTPHGDLHYSIVLKDDNEENRSILFGFLNGYHSSMYERRYPIYFQVVPVHLTDKIYKLDEIIVNEQLPATGTA